LKKSKEIRTDESKKSFSPHIVLNLARDTYKNTETELAKVSFFDSSAIFFMDPPLFAPFLTKGLALSG
jgi:hypothetical protein